MSVWLSPEQASELPLILSDGGVYTETLAMAGIADMQPAELPVTAYVLVFNGITVLDPDEKV